MCQVFISLLCRKYPIFVHADDNSIFFGFRLTIITVKHLLVPLNLVYGSSICLVERIPYPLSVASAITYFVAALTQCCDVVQTVGAEAAADVDHYQEELDPTWAPFYAPLTGSFAMGDSIFPRQESSLVTVMFP